MKTVFQKKPKFTDYFKSETREAPASYQNPNIYPETFYSNKKGKTRNKLLKASTTSY